MSDSRSARDTLTDAAEPTTPAWPEVILALLFEDAQTRQVAIGMLMEQVGWGTTGSLRAGIDMGPWFAADYPVFVERVQTQEGT